MPGVNTDPFAVLYEKGLNDRDIADAVGCSRDTVLRWRARAGLPANQVGKRSRPSDSRPQTTGRRATGDSPKPSLADFLAAKKRADCPVCKLPVDVRGQLADARNKKITLADQVEWLKLIGSTVGHADLVRHNNARHDLL